MSINGLAMAVFEVFAELFWSWFSTDFSHLPNTTMVDLGRLCPTTTGIQSANLALQNQFQSLAFIIGNLSDVSETQK